MLIVLDPLDHFDASLKAFRIDTHLLKPLFILFKITRETSILQSCKA